MEKEKSAFFKGWLRFWKWIATLFEDQGGAVSQKRVIPLGAFLLFWRIVEANIADANFKVNDTLLWAIIIIILGSIGMTLPEWFSKRGMEPVGKPEEKPKV